MNIYVFAFLAVILSTAFMAAFTTNTHFVLSDMGAYFAPHSILMFLILVIPILAAAGLFSSLFYAVILLKIISSIQEVGGSLSMALLNLLYAAAVNLILLPVHSKLKIKIAEYMQE